MQAAQQYANCITIEKTMEKSRKLYKNRQTSHAQYTRWKVDSSKPGKKTGGIRN